MIRRARRSAGERRTTNALAFIAAAFVAALPLLCALHADFHRDGHAHREADSCPACACVTKAACVPAMPPAVEVRVAWVRATAPTVVPDTTFEAVILGRGPPPTLL